MNIVRAKEIAESAELFNVKYEGIPVNIQHVDEKAKMARVYPIGKPDSEIDVPVHTLVEG